MIRYREIKSTDTLSSDELGLLDDMIADLVVLNLLLQVQQAPLVRSAWSCSDFCKLFKCLHHFLFLSPAVRPLMLSHSGQASRASGAQSPSPYPTSDEDNVQDPHYRGGEDSAPVSPTRHSPKGRGMMQRQGTMRGSAESLVGKVRPGPCIRTKTVFPGMGISVIMR